MSEETAAPASEARFAWPLAVNAVVDAPPLIVKSPLVMVEEAFARKPPLKMLAILLDVATRFAASTRPEKWPRPETSSA